MDELLKRLVESEMLTDDSKKELTEAFQTALNEAIAQAKTDTEVAVRAELTEQFVTEKDAIVEAMDTKIEQALSKHIKEHMDDIENFRDLEAEFATRLVDAKSEMAEAVKRDMAELIDKLDAFNTQCMEEEFAEFEESINESRKEKFGTAIFEAVAGKFAAQFADSNETLNQLKEAQEKLNTTQEQLKETVRTLDAVKRTAKLSEVLEPLQGRTREVMEAILKTTPTEKLEEAYEKFIGRVLHDVSETAVNESEKESEVSPVLAESKNAVTEETVVVHGNGEKIVESTESSVNKLSDESRRRLRNLAGVENFS